MADYRRGRVLLAGDAAHLVSPVGGQGMNLGIQDAVNLGWKLVHVVRGWSHPDLLDTYQAERRPAAAAAQRISEVNTRMFTERRAVARGTRDMVIRTVNRLPPLQRWLTWGPAGLLQRYHGQAVASSTAPRHRDPRPGTPLPRWLGQDRPRGLDFAPDGPPLLLASPRVHHDAPQDVPEGVRWAPRLDLHGPDLLVRPDGFVGWCGHGMDDELAALLTRPVGLTRRRRSEPADPVTP